MPTIRVLVGIATLISITCAFDVVGYVPEWRFNGLDWEAAAKYTTHLILFSIEAGPDGSLAAMDRFPNADVLKIAREAADRHGTKLLVCVGGNSRSGTLPTLVLDPKQRQTFAKNLADLCAANGLAGVDMNWEYPRRDAEWNGLWQLMSDIRKAIGPDRILTMAMYPGQEAMLSYATINVAQVVDRIHMMSYDSTLFSTYLIHI